MKRNIKFIMKLRYVRKLIIIIFILSALGFSVRAQMFPGYDQFCSVPVIVVPNPQTASAARDQYGNPVIYIDPVAMSNWSEMLRLCVEDMNESRCHRD